MFKYVNIGKILKSHHSNGELVATINHDFIEDMHKAKAIFIEIDGLNVPFFIEQIDCDDTVCTIKFEEFNRPEDVKKYNNSILSLRETDIDWQTKPQQPSLSNYSDFVDFEIFDTNSKNKLIIESIEQFPHQLMAKTISDKDKTDIFIPLIPEFIEEVDYVNKIITMSLPEGMI